jgi:tRNA threonylcarbamoyladenosine biosynthesis protein TsaE
MALKEVDTQNAKETQKLGRILAEEILKTKLKNKKALVLSLEGNLGSGKTTFVQGLAKGLGIKDKITSPTFVILKRYTFGKRNFYHIDCYRIVNSKDILELGFGEIVSQPENIIVIEWAEKIKNILPRDSFWIKFEHLDKNKRRILINK